MNTRADFSSEEYVLSKPELLISDKMKKEAERKSLEICNKIFERRSREIKEDEDDDNPFEEYPSNIKEIEEELRDKFDDNEIKKEIYNRMISELIRNESINDEALIKEYLSRLHRDLLY